MLVNMMAVEMIGGAFEMLSTGSVLGLLNTVWTIIAPHPSLDIKPSLAEFLHVYR